MKRTTNAIQRQYMTAKAQLETLESIAQDLERDYIRVHHIVNADGTIPTAIYCIDDEATFDRANAETDAMPEHQANWTEQLKAREALKAAEDALIAYGLSIAPAKVRETLRRAAATDYTTRCKIIDLAFRLDVSTVRA